MRVGFNPLKNKKTSSANYLHQVIIPVYIPNFQDYFQDSFRILKLCVNSLLDTVHEKTFITIVNNGSCFEVQKYLNSLFENNKIHEIIHTENIGKLNAVLKGISGNNIPYITISDFDVLFCKNWQNETMKIFNSFKKSGVVGTTPQFKMYEQYCGNVLFEKYFSKQLKFTKVEQPLDLEKFYFSIGWTNDYNQDYLKYNLSIQNKNGKALLGSGHFIATYSRVLFKEIPTFFNFKMGGNSEAFLDSVALEKGLWRLTTTGNYTFHMGNVFETWMDNTEISVEKSNLMDYNLYNNDYKYVKKISKFQFLIKNKLFPKLLFSTFIFKKLFYIRFKLPKNMIKNY